MMKRAWTICAVSIALFASCARPLAPRQEMRRRPAFQGGDWPACHQPEAPPPAFLDSSEACAPSDDPHDHGPETCVPDEARGPELAYDEALGMRVFRACRRTVEHGTRGPPLLDRRRIMIERTGPGSFGGRNSLVRFVESMYERFAGADLAIRGVRIGECPETGGPDPDAGSSCAVVELGDTDVDPPKLMRAFASLYAGAPEGCVPMVVELGVPKPCPQLEGANLHPGRAPNKSRNRDAILLSL
jgi:hypothetical protein